MYEITQSLCALFLESSEKIYTKSSVDVNLYSTEDIPLVSSQDIIIVDQGSQGKDITINLNVTGTTSDQSKVKSLIIPVPVIDAGQKLDEQGVRNAIGSKVYNVTVRVLKNDVLKSSDQGEVNNGSKIEID